jgi:hypothetical protein
VSRRSTTKSFISSNQLEDDRWEEEYPWLAESNVRVIDGAEPPLYRLFAESSAQIGVGSTAVYERLCFDVETFVFEADGAELLRPLLEDGVASFVGDVDELVGNLGSGAKERFDREQFFRLGAVENILEELDRIREHNRVRVG